MFREPKGVQRERKRRWVWVRKTEIGEGRDNKSCRASGPPWRSGIVLWGRRKAVGWLASGATWSDWQEMLAAVWRTQRGQGGGRKADDRDLREWWSGDGGSSRCDRDLDSGHFLKVQPMRLAYGCHIICESKDSNMDIKDFWPEQPQVWNCYLLR